MPKDTLPAQDIDISDIARGRRITAVAATELELVPRRSTRPERPGPVHRIKRRATRTLLRLVRRFPFHCRVGTE